MSVPSRGVTDVTTTIASLALVVQSSVEVVARKVTSHEPAKPQPRQLVKLPELVSVKPATVVERSGTISETVQRQ